MGRVETRKKQKKEAEETKFRTREEQKRGAVGEKNMSKYNPGRLLSGKMARPDDASKSRTKKEQEQARGQRFVAPLQSRLPDKEKGELTFRNFGIATGAVDPKTKKQIVSKDRDIPTRKQEKERAKLAKKEIKSGGMIKYRGGGIVSRSRPTKYI